VTRDACLPSALVRWIEGLHESLLGDLAILLVKGLQIWGFVISQALWMVIPFMNGDRLAEIATALEDEETMEALYDHIVDGGTVKGAAEGR
jgi:hypothetical protein